MTVKFDQRTFKYFDLAAKDGQSREWFEENEDLYLDHVRKPMLSFVTNLWAEIDDELPGIEISAKKILRPVKPVNKIVPGDNAVKNYINVNFLEKENSRFEWNPGIYFQLSSVKDDNYVIVGLDRVTSRQLKLLREGFTVDYTRINSVLTNRKFKASWGELQGERYSRFPKSYQETQRGAEYLWQKQSYVAQQFTRKEVMAPDFSQKLVKDLKIAVPFLQWVRDTVGTVGPYLGNSRASAEVMMDW